MTGDIVSRAEHAGAISRERTDHEAELVRLARLRQDDAWTQIYHQNYDRLFRYVHARVHDRETAEDLTATVFLEALKSINGYRHTGRPLLAWLYTIARNVVNQHHRARFRKGHDRLTPLDEPATSSGELLDHDLIERLDLRDCIAALPESQREVVLLHYFMGLTIPQVAQFVGKHERAVYSLQTRAIQGIRRRLDHQPRKSRGGSE